MTDAEDDYFRKFPDHATRELLGNPDNLRELVAAVAPNLVEQFEFSRMLSVEREFRLEDWREREADRLFELPYREAGMEIPVLVCVLVEHQSTPDLMMPFRLLQYAVLYWDRQWKHWRGASSPRDPLQFNVVLPIVFYTGSRPWTTNRDLSELFAGPETLRSLVPHWPPLVWDITQRSPQELLAETGMWLRSLAIVRAEREDRHFFSSVLHDVIDGLDELAALDRVRWHDLMRFVISWAYFRRPREEADELKELITTSQKQRTQSKEVSEMAETVYDKILEDGKILARRADLKRVIQKSFPDAPPDVLDRIDAIDDSARLQDLFDRALDAHSLDDIPL